MKYFLQLSYKGTKYNGWQKQPNFSSIQGEIESALVKMLGKKVNCIGCGRTDSGVHAHQYYCHIVWNDELDFDLVFRLNKMLPDDISVKSFFSVPPKVHAQHSAFRRTYTYFIHHEKNPHLNELSALYDNSGLEYERMEKAIEIIRNQIDFYPFCKNPASYKSTICELSKIAIKRSANKDQLAIQFTSDRFLRGMVRILVANIMEVGYGRMSVDELAACFAKAVRPKYFREAYPQGLYLTKVEYPFFENTDPPLFIGNISSSFEK